MAQRKYNLEDLIGKQFNDLTVVGYDAVKASYVFQCRCGVKITMAMHYVITGTKKRCRLCINKLKREENAFTSLIKNDAGIEGELC